MVRDVSIGQSQTWKFFGVIRFLRNQSDPLISADPADQGNQERWSRWGPAFSEFFVRASVKNSHRSEKRIFFFWRIFFFMDYRPFIYGGLASMTAEFGKAI